MSDFVTNGDFPGGGQGDWGTGMGLLKVFVNSRTVPVLTVPLNLEATLKLDNGYVLCIMDSRFVFVYCVFYPWNVRDHAYPNMITVVSCGM